MKNKQSLIQVSRRANVPFWQKAVIYVVAILLAFGITALVLTSLGIDVGKYFENMLTIGLSSSKVPSSNFEGMIETLIPMLIVSLGLALSFRIKFWNIGGEGQFICGAIVGYLAAYFMTESGITSPWLIMLGAGLAGGLAGAIYGLIPAVLKVKFGTNETLLTLMLNYLAMYFLQFLGKTGTAAGGEGIMKNIFLNPKSPRPSFAMLALKSRMPKITFGDFDLNISLLIALALFVFFYFYLRKSKSGYEMNVVGDSIPTARYAGMNVGFVTIRTVAISAFLVGLAGALYFCSCGQLSESITNNVGFTGIVVAWLAKLNPIIIAVVSLLLSILNYGAKFAGSVCNVDANFASVIYGIILFTILACEFFINFKVNLHFGKKKEDAA